MSEDQSIVLRGFAGEIEIIPEAQTQKLALIQTAKQVTQVTNDDEQRFAISAERNLGNLRKQVEASRKIVKAPVLDLGKKIDQTAADFIEDVEREEKRLQGLINHHQRKLLQQRAEAEQRANAERLRIEAEAAAARRLEEMAEQQRIAAENAKTAKARAAALAEAARLEQEAFDKALEAEADAIAVQPAPAPVEMPKGLSAREFVDYEILGANEFAQHQSLVRFATAYPNLVKIEIRRRDLLEALNDGRITEAPGIRIRKDLKTSVR